MRLQGVYPPGTFGMLQLPKEWYNALEWQYPPHQASPSCAAIKSSNLLNDEVIA